MEMSTKQLLRESAAQWDGQAGESFFASRQQKIVLKPWN